MASPEFVAEVKRLLEGCEITLVEDAQPQHRGDAAANRETGIVLNYVDSNGNHAWLSFYVATVVGPDAVVYALGSCVPKVIPEEKVEVGGV